MSLSALIGLQWGDEGKGKVVDATAESVDLMIRAQGGANAGHTVKVGDRTRVLHLVPSGMLYPKMRGLIGNGVVVDPFQLLTELEGLQASGHDLTGRLFLSDRAHLVLPYHKEMDEALESQRGGGAIGTTKRGIGPAYMDKAGRTGIRAGEMKDLAALRNRILEEVHAKNRFLRSLGRSELDGPTVADRMEEVAVRLVPMIADTVSLALDALDGKQEVLIEGAQGSLLDLDLGTYPYVTSSNCHVGGLLAGSGLPPRALGKIVGVAKAYCTRVGGGPFPTEDHGPAGQALRDRGHEYGSTTGRPRRCGWLDLVALRHAVRINGVTEIALTKADVLAGHERIRVGTAYDLGGTTVERFPAGVEWEALRPVYRDFPGFTEDLAEVRTFEKLPSAMRALVGFIEERCEVPVRLISTGPERGQVILR